jgi:ubiquitin-activating enzyme E1 C
VEWEKQKKKILDPENEEHIQWIYQQALHRARQFQVQGVSLEMTKVYTIFVL